MAAARIIWRKMSSKIQWTDKMNDDLLECKQKALDLVKSSNPLRLDSGRKKGYMAVMKDLWETMGYCELGLSSQNLRDQAQRLEKIQYGKGEVVRNDIRLESTGNRMDRSQSLLKNNSHDLEAEADLHMEDVTAKSNSVPKRPIAINSFVKEALCQFNNSERTLGLWYKNIQNQSEYTGFRFVPLGNQGQDVGKYQPPKI